MTRVVLFFAVEFKFLGGVDLAKLSESVPCMCALYVCRSLCHCLT